MIIIPFSAPTRKSILTIMDNSTALPSQSLVVQMEQDQLIIQQPHFPGAIAKAERNRHPALAVDESASSRLKSFAQPREPSPAVTTAKGHSHPIRRHEKAIVSPSNQRKLDTTERRQLRAQLRGAQTQEVTPGNEVEDLQQNVENLRRSKHSSLTNLPLEESVRRGQSNDTIIDFSGEGVRPESPQITSADSETGISRNGDRGSTTTIGSQTSEESRKVGQKDRMGSSTTTGTAGGDTEEMNFISEAWHMFETSWKWQIRITDEERENGYRFTDQIDESYLGFRPRRNDKRKFLRAYPIIGPVPEARLGCNCSTPMTFSQWSCVVLIFTFLLGIGVGGYFLFNRSL